MRTIWALFLASWSLVSCTTTTTTHIHVLQNVSAEPDEDMALAVAPVDPVTGTWAGTYTCAQGLTGLVLEMSLDPDGAVAATFMFHAVAQNPEVPSGSFTMFGRLEAGGLLPLRADRWISRPPYWVTVDLVGRLSSDGRYYTGQVEGPAGSCTSFSLERQSQPMSRPGAW